MNRNLIARLSLAAMLSICACVQAQDSDVSQYFEDGNISKAWNVTKINLTTPIVGDFQVSHEMVAKKKIGFEVGLGVLPFYLPIEMMALIDYNDELKTMRFGYSKSLTVKAYMGGQGPEGGYFCAGFRDRNYLTDSITTLYDEYGTPINNYDDMKAKKIVYRDLLFGGGMQMALGKRIMLDYNMMVGFRLKKYVPFDSSLNGTYYRDITYNQFSVKGVVLPLNIKIGYKF